MYIHHLAGPPYSDWQLTEDEWAAIGAAAAIVQLQHHSIVQAVPRVIMTVDNITESEVLIRRLA